MYLWVYIIYICWIAKKLILHGGRGGIREMDSLKLQSSRFLQFKKNPMIGLDENTNLSCFDMQLGSHPRQRGGKSVLFFIVQDNKQKISCRKKK